MKQRIIFFLLMFLINRLFKSTFIKGLKNSVLEAESLSLSRIEKQQHVLDYLQRNWAQLKTQYPERLINLATEIVVAYVNQ